MKLFTTLLILTISFALSANEASKLKNLVTVKGVRQNPIIGYGLVIGLNGTGDSGGEITNTSLKRMFQKLGLNPKQEVSSKNVAAVIVTTQMPPFSRIGQTLDVKVSSIGDASSLAGGTLLVTPLKGGDGQVYAIASGSVSIGGLEKGSKFPTIGRITSGATIERELELNFHQKKSIRLSLNQPDFTTAARIERTLNQELGGKYATARDATTIDLIIPVFYKRKVIQLMAIIENYRVHTDRKAKIVINERTGTIVAGGDVKLRPVAISHGDLSIEVGGAGGGGGAGSGNQKETFFYVDKQSSLNELVKGLNALGTSPEDLISIFQALKQNGALIGELEFL